MPLRFRTARADDIGAIVTLVESAYRGDASRAGWTTEADLLDGQRTDADEVAGLVADPAARLVLAEDERGALVGSVLVKAEPAAAYIGMFAVRPTRQGEGLGAALLAEAERTGKVDFGQALGRMTVIAQRAELIAWYQRRGWRMTSAREPFPYGDPRAGAPRRADLYFVVLEKHL
jgi:ribosomal protein S18 acetylase RimI-like enzyme